MARLLIQFATDELADFRWANIDEADKMDESTDDITAAATAPSPTVATSNSAANRVPCRPPPRSAARIIR